jgi:hypothetical protein
MRVRGLCCLAALLIFAGFGVEVRASCPTSQPGPPLWSFGELMLCSSAVRPKWSSSPTTRN